MPQTKRTSLGSSPNPPSAFQPYFIRISAKNRGEGRSRVGRRSVKYIVYQSFQIALVTSESRRKDTASALRFTNSSEKKTFPVTVWQCDSSKSRFPTLGYFHRRKLFLVNSNNLRTFAADFRRKSRSVVSSSCWWKPEKLSFGARESMTASRVLAWAVGCFSTKGISQDPHQ